MRIVFYNVGDREKFSWGEKNPVVKKIGRMPNRKEEVERTGLRKI